MITAGNIWAEIASELRQFDDDYLKQIKSSCQLSYFDLASKTPWEILRREASFNFANADPTTHTMLMPADLLGIEAVFGTYGTHNNIEYMAGSRYGNVQRSTYAFAHPVQDALAVFSDVTVLNLGTTWTGGTWDASYIGEGIRFGAEPGIYTITAANTFTPRYYGESIMSGIATIRPVGTKRMLVKNEYGEAVTPTVNVYYWVSPIPLYCDEQDIFLPTARPLELATLIRMLGSKDRRESDADRYRAEYREALQEAIAMNPRFSRPRAPTNQHGYRVFDMDHGGNGTGRHDRWGRY
jgi:hypothetical protein